MNFLSWRSVPGEAERESGLDQCGGRVFFIPAVPVALVAGKCRKCRPGAIPVFARRGWGLNTESSSRVVWSWGTDSRNTPAVRRTPTLAVRVAVGAAVGALLYFLLHREVLAWVVCGISMLMLASGLLLPALYAKIERLVLKLGQVAGAVLTWVLLVPAYYVIFGTGRLMLAVRRRDPLKREFPTSLPTYWEDHQVDTDPVRYRRQH